MLDDIGYNLKRRFQFNTFGTSFKFNYNIIRKSDITNSMDYLSEITKQFAEDIVKPRRYNYSQQTLYNFLETNQEISCNAFKVLNKRKNALQVAIFYNKQSAKSRTCVIYAHGLGSNKIQILPIVQSFNNLSNQNLRSSEFHLCSFDFSASGRSQGDYTTYGIRQQEDVISILSWLDSIKKYDRYILWGRSMGAASVILSQSQQLNPKVQCIILDSPFASFEKVAIELANKKFMLPVFMAELMIQPLKKYIDDNYPFNPFKINTSHHIKNINCKIMLMYSKNDNIVDHQHSKTLKNNCKKTPFEIQLTQDHNAQRGKQTMLKILHFIDDSIKANNRQQRISDSVTRGRGISLTSKQKDRKMSVSCSRKGIFNVTQKCSQHKLLQDAIDIKIVPYASLQSVQQSKRMRLSRNQQYFEQKKTKHQRKASYQQVDNMKQMLEKKLLGISQSNNSITNYRKNRGFGGSRIQSIVYNQGNNLKQSNKVTHEGNGAQIQSIKTINSMEQSWNQLRHLNSKHRYRQNKENSMKQNNLNRNNMFQHLLSESYANIQLPKRISQTNRYEKKMMIESVCHKLDTGILRNLHQGRQNKQLHINMVRKNRFR